MILNVQELGFFYRNHSVLQKIAFEVNHSEIVAILGPNGVGKTTLLKSLARLLRPSQGQVLFEGRDVWTQTAQQTARHTAVTGQNEICDWPLAVEEAILLGRSPHRGALLPFTAEDRRLATRALERMHLGPLRTRPVTQLSGGEWRRVMLARALAQQPRALLLDEPTAQLDLKHQIEILSHLRQLAHEDNLVIVVTLHDLNQAAQFADCLALLSGTGLAACGPARDVLSSEILSRTYDLPIQVVNHPLYEIPWVIPLVTGGG